MAERITGKLTPVQEREMMITLLEAKLDEAKKLLHKCRMTEGNNPVDRLPLRNMKRAKKIFTHTLREQTELQIPDYRQGGELAYASLVKKLESELRQTNLMIKKELCDLEKRNKKLESLQNQLTTFDNICAASLSESFRKQAQNICKAEKELKAELHMHKVALAYVIDTIYGEDKRTKILISKLLQTYAENGNGYIEVSDDEYLVSLELFKAKLIKRHPYDPKKIRLC